MFDVRSSDFLGDTQTQRNVTRAENAINNCAEKGVPEYKDVIVSLFRFRIDMIWVTLLV